jgi:hypothetical protein
MDDSHHQSVDRDGLVPGACSRGPFSQATPGFVTAAFDRSLPRLGRLRDPCHATHQHRRLIRYHAPNSSAAGAVVVSVRLRGRGLARRHRFHFDDVLRSEVEA